VRAARARNSPSNPSLPWVAALALACAGEGPAPDSAAPACLGAPTAEIGTGTDAFEPLEDGDDLTMAFGPQGGWHLTTALRLEGVSDAAKFHPTATVTSMGLAIAGKQVPENRELPGCTPPACACEAPNLRVFLDVDSQEDICRLEGEQVAIAVEVTDLATGATTQAARVVTAQLDPVDVPGCRP
jgi:hypothetical protein